jgi:sporulation protein YunB
MSQFRARKLKSKRSFSSRGPMPRSRRLMIWIGSIFTIVVLLLFFVHRSISPPLIAIAEMKSKQIATDMINKAIKEKVQDQLDMAKLMTVTKDNEGRIEMIQYNTALVNSLLTATTDSVHHSLQEMEQNQDGTVYEIPLGMVTDNALLANIGPKIPVEFMMVGEIKPDVVHKITPSGINNTFVEIAIAVHAEMQVILPFVSEKVKVETTVPLSQQVIQGKVPDYYGGGNGSFVPVIPADKKTKGSN